ncbi:MAG: ATP-grasp domain-containing protein [Ginsengibacter sp.]
MGHHVILCDFLPDNPGRKYADEYYPISTTDIDSILKLSVSKRIDGILTYASDPAASTAAFVAEQLNLPGNPYQSVQILSRKDLFRKFLAANDFFSPPSETFDSLAAAREYFNSMNCAVMLKPVDSSGSKGVFKITSPGQLENAFNQALRFSRVKKIIIEQYIERKGFQIAGDGLVLDGKLVFRCFGQEHFIDTTDHFVPIGESFPLQLPGKVQDKIHAEISRLMTLLNMKGGALNFDIFLNSNDDVYLMEIGPRAGGNMISETIKYCTGIDPVEYIVKVALGLEYDEIQQPVVSNFYSSYIIHSRFDGIFNDLKIDSSLKDNIVKCSVFVKKGMHVNSFINSGCTLGYLILRFDSAEEMLEKMNSMNDKVSVIIL